jgi:hypothetical protein
MKRHLDRTKRLAMVMKKMHDLENVRLANAQRTLAARKEVEEALIEAFLATSTKAVPFLSSIGRRLNAAEQHRQEAVENAERIQAECLVTMSKHATLDRRAEKAQALWTGIQERAALNETIEAFGSSVPQATQSTFATTLQVARVAPCASDECARSDVEDGAYEVDPSYTPDDRGDSRSNSEKDD